MESGSFDIGFMRLINTYLKNEFVSNLLPKTAPVDAPPAAPC
jgi:hypothetical protein